MERPVKVIHKYRNANRKMQHILYVFVGNLIGDPERRALEKIKDLSLVESWLALTSEEHRVLEDWYGVRWYYFFFHSEHIQFSIQTVRDNLPLRDQLIARLGVEWVDRNTTEYVRPRVLIAYETKIGQNRKRSIMRKLKQTLSYAPQDDSETMDRNPNGYHIVGDQTKPYRIIDSPTEESWCDHEDTPQQARAKPEDDELPESTDPEEDEDYNPYRDLDEIQQRTDSDMTQIRDILKQHEQTSDVDVVSFDDRDYQEQYAIPLASLYRKNYVYQQYIYQDDSIDSCKLKICAHIGNNPALGDPNYLLPAYQYLWSEYQHKGSSKHISLGQAWMNGHIPLAVPIVPDDRLTHYRQPPPELVQLRNKLDSRNRAKLEWQGSEIIHDYEDYITANEIYLMDVLNYLGRPYASDSVQDRNVYDTLIRLYFPKISTTEFRSICRFLGYDAKAGGEVAAAEYREFLRRMDVIHACIWKNLVMDTKIRNTVEQVRKMGESIYGQYTDKPCITLAGLRSYLRDDYQKVDMYHVFNSFQTDETYPFIQYHSSDQRSDQTRFHDETIRNDPNQLTYLKWFEKTSVGITCKIRIGNNPTPQYATVSFTDTGRIDCKVSWKASACSSLEQAREAREYVYRLISKINLENIKHTDTFPLIPPSEDGFSFLFLNSIARYRTPTNLPINHNDLSNFARYFYPYALVIISPNKRKADVDNNQPVTGKYGTYLRYKLISGYNLEARIITRVIYYLKNYQFTVDELIDHISVEYSVTRETARKAIEKTISENSRIKKSRKELKPLSEAVAHKPPGIEVAFQGRVAEKFSIKVDGVKSGYQLCKIHEFNSILVYLYVQAYILRDASCTHIIKQLEELNTVAKRISLVADLIPDANPGQSTPSVRASASDPIQTKQLSRKCQNSGDKRRRPIAYLDEAEVLGQGYYWSTDLQGREYGHYRKEITYKGKAVTLRALQISDPAALDRAYYVCSPEENGDHIYSGFLNTGKGQGGLPMPCCFLKNQLDKTGNQKDHYLQSIGLLEHPLITPNTISSDQFYIRQDSNNLPPGRLGHLPEHLNIMFNLMAGSQSGMEGYHLDSADNFFFKYGVVQSYQAFLHAIAALVDQTVVGLLELFEKTLLADHQDQRLFTSLWKGQIRLRFRTVEAFLKYLHTHPQIHFSMLLDLLAHPGCVTEKGLLVVIFQKKVVIESQSLEKDVTRIMYRAECYHAENRDIYRDGGHDVGIVIQDQDYYYPVVMINKEPGAKNEAYLQKTFTYQPNPHNIVHRIHEFYSESCRSELVKMVRDIQLAKYSSHELLAIIAKSKKYLVDAQYVDPQFLCRYLVLRDLSDKKRPQYLLPTIPSGSISTIAVLSEVETCSHTISETIKFLSALSKETGLLSDPTSVIYTKQVKDQYHVIAIVTQQQGMIPVIPSPISRTQLDKLSLDPIKGRFDAKIDRSINNRDPPGQDLRLQETSQQQYRNEIYQSFRYHFSRYLHATIQGQSIREQIVEVAERMPRKTNLEKVNQIKQILYHSLQDSWSGGDQLLAQFQRANQAQKISLPKVPDLHLDSWANVLPNNVAYVPPLDYRPDNIRTYCEDNDPDDCRKSSLCHQVPGGACQLSVSEEMLVQIVNAISAELVMMGISYDEIMRNRGYSVSNVIDRKVFTHRPGERMLVFGNIKLDHILDDLFGLDQVLKNSKKIAANLSKPDYRKIRQQHPSQRISQWISQSIIPQKDSIIRAFVNSYYWILHPGSIASQRNLGYYSSVQTKLARIYKSQVVAWIAENAELILQTFPNLTRKQIDRLILKLQANEQDSGNGMLEYFALSKINQVGVILYNRTMDITFAWDQRSQLVRFPGSETDVQFSEEEAQNMVHIQIVSSESDDFATKVYSLYPRAISKQ